MKKRILHIRQTAENECGLCCISILSSFYGFIQPLSYYRNKYNVGRDGLSLFQINHILSKIGFDSEVYEVKDLYKFFTKKNSNRPILAHLHNNHFVVIILSKSSIQVYDPAKEVYKISYENFQKIFSGYLLIANPNNSFKKEKNLSSEFRHLFPIIKKSLNILLVVIIASMISYLVSIVIPLIMQATINSLSNYDKINYIKILISISEIVFVFCLISYFRNKSFIRLQTKLCRIISFETIQHLFKIKYSFFDNRSQGNIMYRLNFLTQIQATISNEILNLVLSFTSIIVICIYFLLIYSDIFPYILILMIIIFLSVGFYNKRILIKKRREVSSKEKVENTITEIVNNMFQIKCLHLDNFFFKSYSLNFSLYEKEFIASQSSIQTLGMIINAVFNYLPIYCIIIILILFQKNNYTVGELFALYSFFTTLFTQCYTFINEISTISLLKASLFYLNDLLDEPEIDENNENKIDLYNFKSLEVKNVCFRYDSFNRDVLKNINIKIKSGEKIAIVGLSGSGKTTLIKLLSNLYNPTEGSILINNTNIENINKNSISKIFSFVPQSPVFFNKSIRDNITLDDSSYTDKEIIDTLKLTNIWDDIQLMPMGLETIVSGQGGNMSGGQIQRLSLARALINKPQILVMDEATSSLDAWNEQIIYSNLKKAKISQIIISHRLSTIKDADCIYVLSNGYIVEQGTHDNLIKEKKFYYNLFKYQNEGGKI